MICIHQNLAEVPDNKKDMEHYIYMFDSVLSDWETKWCLFFKYVTSQSEFVTICIFILLKKLWSIRATQIYWLKLYKQQIITYVKLPYISRHKKYTMHSMDTCNKSHFSIFICSVGVVGLGGGRIKWEKKKEKKKRRINKDVEYAGKTSHISRKLASQAVYIGPSFCW